MDPLDNPAPSRHATPALLAWQVLLLAYAAGLAALELPAAGLAGLAVLAGLARGLAAWPTPRLALLLAAFLAGLGAAWLAMPALPEGLPDFVRERDKVTVRGIVEESRGRPGMRLQVVLKDVECGLPEAGAGGGRDGRVKTLPGRLVWNWDQPSARPGPGDRVELQGRVRPVGGFLNEGVFDYSRYWARRGVLWRAYTRGPDETVRIEEVVSWPWKARRAVLGSALALADAPSRTGAGQPGMSQGAATLLALVMGEEMWVDETSMDLVRRASLAHALALSGFNVAFVAWFGLALATAMGWLRPALFLRLPRQKLAVLLGAPLVLGYLWLGQAPPSLLRATVMFGFWSALLVLGRSRIALDGLLFALAAILIVSPLSLFDMGLQLSALAVAGLIVLYPPLHGLILARTLDDARKWLLRPVLVILGSSLCAQAAVLPLLVSSFGQVNPHLHLNVVWLPVLGWIALPLGLAGVVLSAVPGLGETAAVCLKAGAAVMDGLLGSLAWLDRAGLLGEMVPLRPLWPAVLGYYLALLALVIRDRRDAGRLALTGLAAMALPGLVLTALDARGGVRLDLLDVGQGQAAVVTLPGGGRILLDGGGLAGNFDTGASVVAPALTHGRPPSLELVAMSHGDTDHARGLVYILEPSGSAASPSTAPGPSGSSCGTIYRRP